MSSGLCGVVNPGALTSQYLCAGISLEPTAAKSGGREPDTIQSAAERDKRRAVGSCKRGREAAQARELPFIRRCGVADAQHKENGIRYQNILQESEVAMEKVRLFTSTCAGLTIGEIALRRYGRRTRKGARRERGRVIQGEWHAVQHLDRIARRTRLGTWTRERRWKESSRQGDD